MAEDDGRLVMGPKLDFKASEDLAGDLQARRGRDIEIDASGVEVFGGHALQTILVAAESWRSDGHTLKVAGLSEAALKDLATLGQDPTELENGGTA